MRPSWDGTTAKHGITVQTVLTRPAKSVGWELVQRRELATARRILPRLALPPQFA